MAPARPGTSPVASSTAIGVHGGQVRAEAGADRERNSWPHRGVPPIVNRAHEPGAVGLRWSSVSTLTIAMGVAVAVSWLWFGRGDPLSLEPHHMLTVRRLAIYGSQFLGIAAFVFLMVRLQLRAWSAVKLWAEVSVAWLGQGVVLTLIGTFVANELTPIVAWYFWLVATAGPLQPIAGFVGGWLALRSAPSGG